MTATAEAEEQAVRTEIAELNDLTVLVAGPLQGDLEHDAEDGNIEKLSSFDDLGNFVAHAQLYNPYGSAAGSWDYGFGFRDTGGADQYRLVVQSDKEWMLYLVGGDPNVDLIAKGVVANLDVSTDGSNNLELWVQDGDAYFFVNGAYVTTLDVSAKVR